MPSSSQLENWQWVMVFCEFQMAMPMGVSWMVQFSMVVCGALIFMAVV